METYKTEDSIKLNDRKLVLSNSKLNVFLDDIEEPSGERIKDYLVVAPRHQLKDDFAGVAILPVFNKQLGLLKVCRHPMRTTSWEVPRGFIDKGETAKQAAVRELAEETGLQCSPEKIRFLKSIAPEPGLLQARIALFVAEGESKQTAAPKDPEIGHRDFAFFSDADFFKLIESNQIEDPSTLVAYYHWHAIRQR